MQQLIVETAEVNDEHDPDWTRNGAGKMVNHKYGFGRINAEKLLEKSTRHISLPSPHLKFSTTKQVMSAMDYDIQREEYFVSELEIPTSDIEPTGLVKLEHVQVKVKIGHDQRGHLRVVLKSPSGTLSVLATQRPRDKSKEGFDPWTFMTIRNWGESPLGKWTLQIHDSRYGQFDSSGVPFAAGYMYNWELILYGTCATDDIVEDESKKHTPKQRTCVHTVNTKKQIERNLLVGTVIFLSGTIVTIAGILAYRYKKGEPEDKYFPQRDDLESPVRGTYFPLVTLDNSSDSTYSSPVHQNIPDKFRESDIDGRVGLSASIFKSGSLSSLLAGADGPGGLRRTNSATRPLDLSSNEDHSYDSHAPPGKPLYKAKSIESFKGSLTRSRSGLFSQKDQ